MFDTGNRPPQHGKVYVRYIAPGGLCNQLNSHVNALTLALGLGADAIILPHTLYRPHFNHTPEYGEGEHKARGWALDVCLVSDCTADSLRCDVH